MLSRAGGRRTIDPNGAKCLIAKLRKELAFTMSMKRLQELDGCPKTCAIVRGDLKLPPLAAL